MRSFFAAILTLIAAAGLLAGPAHAASLVARVDIAAQSLTVIEDGVAVRTWKVSTAARGYVTPRGTYAPRRMYVSYFSRKYYNSPMPHSIFFHGGYAIHGTFAQAQLGRPASHGCVRLPRAAAAELYGMVRRHGMGATRIVIT